jgi:hypothetical protein
MASADAFYAKPTSFEDTVLHNCLRRVLAACRLEAAIISEKRRDELLVCSDQYDE